MKNEPVFSKRDAEIYLKTQDKAVFLCELLNLFTIDHLTLEEIINQKEIDLNSLIGRCYGLYITEKVENLWENIGSIKVKNPLYYCLKSKLVWQRRDDENPTYSDKLLELKSLNAYDKMDNIIVAECQQKRLEDYIEGMGEFAEIKRKHIREYKEIENKLMYEKISSKQWRDDCLSLFVRIMEDI